MKIKRSLVILAMAGVVFSAVFLNYSFQKSGGDLTVAGSSAERNKAEDKILGEALFVEGDGNKEVAASNSVKKDYFTEARINRQTTRDESAELLKSIAANKDNPEDVRKKASSDLSQVAAAVEKEGKIENLIKAKGFENCLAVIGDNTVSILVKTSGLSQPQIAQIKETVINETALTGSAVKIVEIN